MSGRWSAAVTPDSVGPGPGAVGPVGAVEPTRRDRWAHGQVPRPWVVIGLGGVGGGLFYLVLLRVVPDGGEALFTGVAGALGLALLLVLGRGRAPDPPRSSPLYRLDLYDYVAVNRALHAAGRGRPAPLPPRLREPAVTEAARQRRLHRWLTPMVAVPAVIVGTALILTGPDGPGPTVLAMVLWFVVLGGGTGLSARALRRAARAELVLADL